MSTDLAAPDNIAILLSTRNGAAFLNAQLESLLAQSHENWQLYWRDDGSADETPDMMRRFAAGAGAGRVVDLNDNAGHVGICASFLGLLRRAPRGLVVAFADQDDVWLPEKLARGLAALRAMPAGLPGLYCARQHLVDAQLTPIRVSAKITGPTGFPHSMAQNIATGCTMMLNAEAASLVADAEAPTGTLHDWWSYILVSASGGGIHADDTPTILYRQHAHNAVGVPLSPRKRAWAAIRRGPHVFMRVFRAHMEALQAQEELLSPPARAMLHQMSDGLHDGWNLRLRALAQPGMQRQSWLETQLFRLWFLLG